MRFSNRVSSSFTPDQSTGKVMVKDLLSDHLKDIIVATLHMWYDTVRTVFYALYNTIIAFTVKKV